MDMEKICGSCHSFTSHMFLIFLISQTDIDMSVDNHLANIGTSNIDIKKSFSKPVATHEGSKGVVMEQHNQPRYKNHAITDRTIAGVSHIAENADTISKVSDQTDSLSPQLK